MPSVHLREPSRLEVQLDAHAQSDDSPLFVDLDGTLIVTDSFDESFVGCLRVAPAALLRIPLWLAKGRARLKAELAAIAKPNAALFPYDERLCSYLRDEKHRGRKLFLATAADQRIAHSVADAVGLFDGIVASDGERNLKGTRKLAAIKETVDGAFSYAGNSVADVPIWQAAASGLVVNAPKSVERRAEASCRVERAFPRRHGQWRDVISAVRPLQWVKNTLVFVPLFTAFQVQDRAALLGALIAFVAFCACASATYVFNDLLDLEADRAHPRKRHRAFASGRVSIRSGFLLAVVLAIAGIGVAGAHSPLLLLILVGYMLATTAYSLRLKHYALLDGIILASLYTSRLAAGVVATGIDPSPWLIAFALFIFCSLALLKRCAELVMLESSGVATTQRRDYRVADLRVLWPFGIALSTCSLVVFVLYVNAPEVRERYASPDLLWLAAIGLAYWLGRMWLKTSRGEMTDDPIVYSLRDLGSRVTVVFIVAATLLAHIVTLGR